MMKQYSFSWSAALMAVGVGALAWAGPEAVQNVQKPALSGGPPVVFGFGGEGNQEFMLNGKPFQIRGAEMPSPAHSPGILEAPHQDRQGYGAEYYCILRVLE